MNENNTKFDKSLEELKEEIVLFHKAMDHISDNIRTIENKLQASSVFIPYKYLIKEDPNHFISWESYKNNAWRFVLKTPESEAKILGECPIAARFKYFPYLQEFLVSFKQYIKKTKESLWEN